MWNAFSTTVVEARLPFLDSYLSPILQSVLVETLFWSVSYILYAQTSQRIARSIFRNKRFWYTAHKRGGLFTQNAQDEIPAYLVAGLQHSFGGVLMFLGVWKDDPILWRHGFLCEMGFEMADLVNIALKLPPYDHGVRDELIVPLVAHHVPGAVVAIVLMDSGLYENPHVMSIGMWLLLAGGLSLLCAFYVDTLDFDRNMKRAATVNLINFSFFFVARFVQFPYHSYYVIQTVRSDSVCGSFCLGRWGFTSCL